MTTANLKLQLSTNPVMKGCTQTIIRTEVRTKSHIIGEKEGEMSMNEERAGMIETNTIDLPTDIITTIGQHIDTGRTVINTDIRRIRRGIKGAGVEVVAVTAVVVRVAAVVAVGISISTSIKDER